MSCASAEGFHWARVCSLLSLIVIVVSTHSLDSTGWEKVGRHLAAELYSSYLASLEDYEDLVTAKECFVVVTEQALPWEVRWMVC